MLTTSPHRHHYPGEPPRLRSIVDASRTFPPRPWHQVLLKRQMISPALSLSDASHMCLKSECGGGWCVAAAMATCIRDTHASQEIFKYAHNISGFGRMLSCLSLHLKREGWNTPCRQEISRCSSLLEKKYDVHCCTFLKPLPRQNPIPKFIIDTLSQSFLLRSSEFRFRFVHICMSI